MLKQKDSVLVQTPFARILGTMSPVAVPLLHPGILLTLIHQWYPGISRYIYILSFMVSQMIELTMIVLFPDPTHASGVVLLQPMQAEERVWFWS